MPEWHPPGVQGLIEAAIPDGMQWYELRMPLDPLSYAVDRYDDALKDAKLFRDNLKLGELFNSCKKNDEIESHRIL